MSYYRGPKSSNLIFYSMKYGQFFAPPTSEFPRFLFLKKLELSPNFLGLKEGSNFLEPKWTLHATNGPHFVQTRDLADDGALYS